MASLWLVPERFRQTGAVVRPPGHNSWFTSSGGEGGAWGAVILPFNAFGAHILGHSTLSGDEQMKEPLSNADT